MSTMKIRIAFSGWFFLLTGFIGSGVALAHDFKGTLGTAPNAETKYMLSCYPSGGYPSEKFAFNISGLTKSRPYTLKLTVAKGEAGAVATDPANGDRKPGLFNSLAEGDGSYFLSISKVPNSGKPAKGTMVFTVQAHCQAANTYHTGTTEPVKLTPIASGFTSFSGSIKAPFTAKSRFLVVCYPEADRPTARYGFRVSAVTKNRPYGLKLSVTKDNGVEETLDFASADGEFSEWSYLEAGDGPYTLELTKVAETGTTRGTMAFKIENMCEAEEPDQLSGITSPIKQ